MTKKEEEYPEDWDSLEQAKAETSEFLKLKSGEEIRLRVLQGPLAFSSISHEWFEGNERKYKSFNVPFGSQFPGRKLKHQWAFEVLILNGPMAGDHKVWAAGKQVAMDLEKIKEAWKDLKKPDIILSKTGEKLLTKWKATAGPSSELAAEELKPMFKLVDKIKYATAVELAELPPVPVGAEA